MTKKTASNVPASSSANSASNGTNNHTSASSSRRPHSTSSSSSHSGNNSPFVNAKHLHAPLHPHKSKQSRDSDAATRATSSENLLMKKLFEAVQKHKVVPEHEREPQQRQNPQKNQQQNLQQNQQQKNQKKKPLKKPSVPASPARPINSSENYAGAAFDRAPAATSFPVPSFASSTSSVLSSSCPSDAFSLQQETKTTVCFSGSSSSKLRALSVSELFKTEPSTDPQKQNLAAVTSDLRKLLNLGKM